MQPRVADFRPHNRNYGGYGFAVEVLHAILNRCRGNVHTLLQELPKPRDTVGIELRIAAQQRKLVDSGLGNQEAVERISIHPVFESQTRNLLEILAIGREQQRVVGERDRRDLEVLHAQMAAPGSQVQVKTGGRIIER